jgi:hypothetical protein
MPASAPVSSFDYTTLDRDTASFVQQQTGEIRALMRRTAQDIFEIGSKLIEIKEKLGHGNFLAWLKAEFDWNERTAQNFMNVARQFKYETVSDLPLAATALYILAAPSTPEAIRAEAIARAKRGEAITKKKAQALARAHSDGQKKKTQQPREETLQKTDFFPPPTALHPSAFPLAAQVIAPELESPPPPKTFPPTKSQTAPNGEVIPEEVRALPPSPPLTQCWRLSGKNQTHLLYNTHPECSEFLYALPERVGVWLGFPPTPDEWLVPPKRRVNMAFSYATIYRGLNLKAIRSAVEQFINETSSDEDETAMLAYLPDAPLLALLDDFGLDCYIAEPDESQCQKILTVWKQLGGEVEELETHPEAQAEA